MSCRSAWAGLWASEPRVPSSNPSLLEPESSVRFFPLPFNTMGQTHWSMFQSQTRSHLPRPLRPQRVPRRPGGSVCPLGPWQGTLALRCVTCRGPVWI